MAADMVLQMTFGNELKIANLAHVVPLPQVTLHMHVQVAFLGELASTVLAYIGLDPKMLSEMNLESRFLIVRDTADETRVEASAHINLALSDASVLADHEALLIQVDFIA
jgi:hypothetical protein